MTTIWQNRLDDRYDCMVVEEGWTEGRLTMVETATGKLVLDTLVPVSKYFRTDDVLSWGSMCIDAANR